MYTKGEISKDQYSQLFSINAFKDAKNLDDGFWQKTKALTDNLKNIISGKLDKLSEDDFQKFYLELCSEVKQNAIYINIFDTQVKKDRVSKGIS